MKLIKLIIGLVGRYLRRHQQSGKVKKLIIGLVGPPLAGKETVGNLIAKIAAERGFTSSKTRFSDILRETLELWSVEINRANLQTLAQIMTKAFGEDALSRAIQNRLRRNSADIVLADGVRWLSDEALIRSMGGLLLYITASPEIRYARMVKRRRDNEELKSWEEFIREENAENEIYITAIGSRSDCTIVNEGTPEELEEKVREFWDKFVAPTLCPARL